MNTAIRINAGLLLLWCVAIVALLLRGEPAPDNIAREDAPYPRHFNPTQVSCQDDGFERWNEEFGEYR